MVRSVQRLCLEKTDGLKKIATIFCVCGMLATAQFVQGQEEGATTGDPPQVRIRIPFHSLNAEQSSLNPYTAATDHAQTVNPAPRPRSADSSNQARKASSTDHGMKEEPSLQARMPGTDLQVYRENIRGDSLDLVIEQSALAEYKTQIPGLKVLRVVPALDNSDMAVNLAEALTFQKYPTYEQYDSMMHFFADTYPSICMIDTFGTSVEGRLLLALKISDNVEEEEDEPAFLYTSTMHGNELVGYVLCLRLVNFLLSNYGMDVEVDRIINDVELWINPISNPDGAYYPDNNSTVQASIRNNVNGVNLNRDFPDPLTGEADDPAGRQPETREMMAFMKQIRPNLSANLHSGAEVVNYPWDHKNSWHPDHEWFILISREYAETARSVNSSYMLFADDSIGITGITNGFDWYKILGGRQDYVTYYLRGREVTLELYNSKRLGSEYLEDYWNYNKWSLINLVTQSRYGIHGNVTDDSGNPLHSVIRVLNYDNDSSLVESETRTGNFYRYLKEGAYDLLISSEGYFPDTVFGVEVFDYQQTPVSVQLISDNTNTGTHDHAANMHVFPNPARDELRLRTKAAFTMNTRITVTDLSGRTLVNAAPHAGRSSFTVDVSALTPGIYVLRRSGDNHPGTVVFSKRE